MKTWNMPRVEMTAFIANEYVAACNTINNLVFKSTHYCDYDNDTTWDGNAESMGYGTSLSTDGKFKAYKCHSSATTGIKKTVNIYQHIKGGDYTGSYSTVSNWSFFDGPYTVYIVTDSNNNKYAYFFEHGYEAPAGKTPIFGMAFS